LSILFFGANFAPQATISGRLRADRENEHGSRPWGEEARGAIALVRRGGAEGEWSPFALKALRAVAELSGGP